MENSSQASTTQDSSINSHHDILSVGPARQDAGLLSFLQSNSNPLEQIFNIEDKSATVPVTQPAEQPTMVLAPKPAVQQERPTMMIMDEERPLSKTLLWQMQEDYYKSVGINAWQQDVPCFVTSSVYIAEAYAEMIISFVRDYWDQLDLSEPIHILELATGTGRFSHLLLRELSRKQAYFEQLKDVKFRYVMSDFTDSNPNFWQKHEKLQPFIESGMLDFAVFNPLVDSVLNLRVSGETIDAGNIRNPMIAISNYFFDSIPQDFFRVESKKLLEGLVTLERNLVGPEGEAVDPESAPHITQVTQRVRYRELQNDRYYDDPKLNAVLNHYRHNIRNGSIIFPIGAFNVIRNLEKLSNNQLMLISSDKAYTCVDHMTCFYEHTWATHSGAFSYMVNYHGIAQYFKNEGGSCFNTTGKNLALQTVCFINVNRKDCKFENLEYLYREKVDRALATTSLVTLLPEGRQLSEMQQLDQMIAQVRMNLADPKIFCVLGQAMVDLIPKGTTGQHQDLLNLIDRGLESYYFFPGEVNLPFWTSQIYYNLGMYHEGLQSLDKTISLFGDHEALFFLKGQNYEKLGQWKQAREMYELALEMKPDFDEANQALIGVQMKVR